jgi:hypothetical protein
MGCHQGVAGDPRGAFAEEFADCTGNQVAKVELQSRPLVYHFGDQAGHFFSRCKEQMDMCVPLENLT